MAFIKIKPIKSNIAHSIEYIKDKDKTTSVERAIDYIDNPFKNHGEFVTGLHCVPRIAEAQFKMVKDRFHKKDQILGYHVIQSFKPDEISKELCHELGIKFANMITDGNYQAVVSTHLDKEHMHNHIVFNSVSHVDGTKYRNEIKSYKRFKEMSDRLSVEYGLSVIDMEQAKGKSMEYKEWKENKLGNSWKQQIKKDIDEVVKLARNVREFETLMQERGIEIKHGKHVAFRKHGMQRYARGKTLGADYTLDAIQHRIDMGRFGVDPRTYKENKPQAKRKFIRRRYTKARSLLQVNIRLTMAIIRQLKINAQNKNVPYAKSYARKSDALVKSLAKQLETIREYNIDDNKTLCERIATASQELKNHRSEMVKMERNGADTKHMTPRLNELKTEVQKLEKVKSDIKESNRHIRNKREIDKHNQRERNDKNHENER